MLVLIFAPLLTGVHGTDYVEWCGLNLDSCSSFCTMRPDDCLEVCRNYPDIPGCKGGGTIAPPECKPTGCCEEETAECLACQVCKPVTEFCATNRAVTGCDEVCCELGCSEECKNVHHTTIKIERQCKWKVMNQQFEAFRPTLLQANVEKSCPFMENYELHLESCQACSRLHKPCNDTYIACGGCCGTPWHSLLGLAINTNHNCDEVKNYFAQRNSAVVACEEESEENKGKPDGTVGMTVHEEEEDVIDEGTLNSTCETNVTRLECKKIPFVLKFECDDCGNKGTPDLLDQCCDKCIEWSNSLANHPNIDPDIMPYVWCSGCNATQIEPVNPIFPPMPWFGASKYETHTEDKAYKAVETYLEEQVCDALPETCPATTPSPTATSPRLLEDADPAIADDDCYAENGGTCASYDFPELIVNMTICTDPRFPYQNTNPKRQQFCYTTKEFANARTGPCDSWCSVTKGNPTDNDGCDGCCGDFNTKICDPQGGRRLKGSLKGSRRLQSPSRGAVEHMLTDDPNVMCKEFDPTYYQQGRQVLGRDKPKTDAADSTTQLDSPTDKPVSDPFANSGAAVENPEESNTMHTSESDMAFQVHRFVPGVFALFYVLSL